MEHRRACPEIIRPPAKSWVSAFRIATAIKVAYAGGLRRNEVRMLELTDLGTNPHAPEFG